MIYFLRFVDPVFFAMRIAAMLSIYIGVAELRSILISATSLRTQSVCCAAVVAEMYSAESQNVLNN